MIIKLGKLTVYPGFLFLFAVFFYFDPGWIIPAAGISVLCHELGHIIAMRIFRIPVKSIEFSITGIAIKIYDLSVGYGAELITAIAGPIGSFLLSYTATCLGKYSSFDYLYIISGMSLVYGFFNLIPARPLDGGTALCTAFYMVLGRENGDAVMKVIEKIVIFLILFFGFSLFIFEIHNPTFIIIPLWMAFYCCKASRNSVEF